jgi:hypothetical protein
MRSQPHWRIRFLLKISYSKCPCFLLCVRVLILLTSPFFSYRLCVFKFANLFTDPIAPHPLYILHKSRSSYVSLRSHAHMHTLYALSDPLATPLRSAHRSERAPTAVTMRLLRTSIRVLRRASHDFHAMCLSDCATTTVSAGPVKDAQKAGSRYDRSQAAALTGRRARLVRMKAYELLCDQDAAQCATAGDRERLVAGVTTCSV